MLTALAPVRTAVTRSSVLDAELRARGTSLDAWAQQRGVCPTWLGRMLDGTGRKSEASEELVSDLADTLGVSVRCL